MPQRSTPLSDKTSTQAYYDRLSRVYDLLAGAAEKKCKRVGLELLNAQPGETVLEIGCGTGQCLPDLAQSVRGQGQVTGIDLSQGMLQVTQNRLRNASLPGRIDLCQGNALQLPFASSSVAAVYMSFTLELFPSPQIQVLLKECKRVLRPAGRIGIVSMAKKDRTGPIVRLYEWAHHKWPVYIDCRPIAVHGELDQAGIKIARCVEMSIFGLPVDIVLSIKDSGF